MIYRPSRFVGIAIAFVAGTVASSPGALAQAARPAAREAAEPVGLLNAVMHSSVSGVVRDRTGQPQVGTAVELLNSSHDVIARTFTDDRGHYTLSSLAAGIYQVRVTSDLFLPTIRPGLRLMANSRAVANLTLSTIYQAMQWLPAEPRARTDGNDDWDWTLRLSTNRPLLRFLDPNLAQFAVHQQAPMPLPRGTTMQLTEDGPVLVETANSSNRLDEPDTRTDDAGSSHLRPRRIAIRSGLNQFGQGGLQQQVVWGGDGTEARAFLMEAQTAFTAGAAGELSTSAAYRQILSPDRSVMTVATFTDRPQIAGDGTQSGLTTMRVRSASTLRLGDLAELDAGTELEAARLGGSGFATGNHPFGSLLVHTGGSTTVAYMISTAPSMTSVGGMDQEASADDPYLSMSTIGNNPDGVLQIEQGMHQELRLTRTLRGNPDSWEDGSNSNSGSSGSAANRLTGELSVYHDSLAHPVVQGAFTGDAANSPDIGEVLYDPGTGTIAVSGAGYSGGGVMALLHDQLSADTWVSLRAAMGEADAAPEYGFAATLGQVGSNFTARQTPMLAVSAGSRIAATGTVVQGGYRWQPVNSLTPVAPFDDNMPDAYLSFALRQPLRMHGEGASKLEAIVDVRNLLAQGYRPFLSKDGSTVYFAQQQRCIAAGIAFSF